MGFTLQRDGVITNGYNFLIGDYTYYKSVEDSKVVFSNSETQKLHATISANDKLIIFKGRKKKITYTFSNTKLPFLQDGDNLVIGIKQEFEPMYYRGDTIILQGYPQPYQENFFIKRK